MSNQASRERPPRSYLLSSAANGGPEWIAATESPLSVGSEEVPGNLRRHRWRRRSGRHQQIEIFDEHFFKDLSGYGLAWELTGDGAVIGAGKLPAPANSARAKRKAKLPLPAFTAKPGVDYRLRVGFRTTTDAIMGPAGYEIAAEGSQMKTQQDDAERRARHSQRQAHRVRQRRVRHRLRQGFPRRLRPEDRRAHRSRIRRQARVQARQGPGSQCIPRPVNNDRWAMDNWFGLGLRHLKAKTAAFTVEEANSNTVRVAVISDYAGEKAERVSDYRSNQPKISATGAVPVRRRVPRRQRVDDGLSRRLRRASVRRDLRDQPGRFRWPRSASPWSCRRVFRRSRRCSPQAPASSPDRQTSYVPRPLLQGGEGLLRALRQAAGHGQPQGRLVGRPARQSGSRRALRRTRQDVRDRPSPTPPTSSPAPAHRPIPPIPTARASTSTPPCSASAA